MWAANAATVSPAPDSSDGKCHLTPANLVTMAHRSHEWPETLAQLRLAFANPAFQAQWQVILAGDRAVDFLQGKLAPIREAPAAEIDRLVGGLDSQGAPDYRRSRTFGSNLDRRGPGHRPQPPPIRARLVFSR